MSFDELVAEYRAQGIGPRIYEEVRAVIRAVVRSYDPVVYGQVVSWDLGLDDLVQEFGQDVLVSQGQLDYAIVCSTDLTHFRRLMARQVRYLLARRRRRTIVDNLLDRARKRVATAPFRMVTPRGEWSYTLLHKDVTAGRVSEGSARSLACDLARIPVIQCEPRQRAPVVFSEGSLQTILQTVADGVECAVGVNDLDRILTRMLTSWIPTFLKNSEGALARAVAGGLDGEESVIVNDVSQRIVSRCDPVQRELLRLKLDGRSDREIAEDLGLSRPTVAKRKRDIMSGLEQELASLRPGVRRAVVDRMVELLSPGICGG
jgi:hypothetical protein